MTSHAPERIELPADVTRLVVLGDPHGDLAALEAVVAREGRAGVSYVSVGDNVGYADGPTSSRLCERLQELGAVSVLGNHEAWLAPDGELAILAGRPAERRLTAAALAWSHALPLRVELNLAAAPALTLSVRHTIGTRWDYVHEGNAHLLAWDEDVRVVFVGHSHAARVFAVGARETQEVARLGLAGPERRAVPLAERVRYVVDAGSLARPGYHPAPGNFALATYATLDLACSELALHALEKPALSP